MKTQGGLALDWREMTEEPAWQVNLGSTGQSGTFNWHGHAPDRMKAEALAVTDAKIAWRLASGQTEAQEPDIFRIQGCQRSEFAQSIQIWPTAWDHIAPTSRWPQVAWTSQEAMDAASALWDALAAQATIEPGDAMGALIGSRSHDTRNDAVIDADIAFIALNPKGTYNLIGNVDVPAAVRTAMMAISIAYHFADGPHFVGTKVVDIPESATLRAALTARLAFEAQDNAARAVGFLERIGLRTEASTLAGVLEGKA